MRANDFKPADSLWDREKKRGRRVGADPEPPPLYRVGMPCPHPGNGLCGLSVKAYEMGLRDAAQRCDGNSPERCEVYLLDKKGLTIPEMFTVAKEGKAKRRGEV